VIATEDRVDEGSLRYEGWRVVAASSVSLFLGSLLVYTSAIFLKPLSEEFTWSREAVSSAFGLAPLMFALCSVPFGYLLDRLGPRAVVWPCLMVFGGGLASLSLLTPHLSHLYAVFIVLGIVAPGISTIAYGRAISSWFTRRRGMALAVAICGGSIGGMVHPPAVQALIRIAGWRTAYLTLGALVLAIGLPTVLRFVRERPRSMSAADPRAAGASIREGLTSRVFWILVIVLFASSLAPNGALVHLSALLTDRGVSASHGAIALSAMAGAAVVGRLLTGWLVDRFFAARVSFALLALGALGTFLLSSAHSITTGMLAAMLIGFGMGGESDVAPYLLSRYFGLRSFSTLYGFTWIASGFAAAAGPILMGRAFDATGSYETLLVRLAIGTLCVATLMLTLPRYDSLHAPLKN
jgi:MFS family permease